ncbi:MAG: hypothetical protein QNK23_10425 [Crocinitomicaceae bacterium]|nr:hypothetical protein [Crocinitomicaceae bacterium]
MKSLLVPAFFLLTVGVGHAQQDCERIVQNCERQLSESTDGSEFISDGQVYTAFLDREKAEFKTTFFGGTTYRISASAGEKDNYVIFTIKDPQGNILFSNKNYRNAPYWDFRVIETLPVTIETELDTDLKVTGCAVMLIGFQR